MRNLLLKAYLNRQQKQQLKRQLCLDCNEISAPGKRLSVINLLGWILIGALVAVGLKFFTDISKVGLIGFLVTAVCTGINIKLLKPQCRHCFSENLSYDIPNTEEQVQN